ncbi:MAG: hypothetical protein QJR02_08305 [Sinobacteraceae bacterium]|nr:hypothetical protein [Nevskiaceae bacterium]
MDLNQIEDRAARYAAARGTLAERVTALQDELERVKRAHRDAIRRALVAARARRDELADAIARGRTLFDSPRTRIFAGIKCGYQKQRGKVEIDDEAAVIRRIRELLPATQANLLVRVRESVDRRAVGDLSVADLKRLGIRVSDDEDVMVLRPADDDLDKLISQLLPDTELVDDAAEQS